MESGISQLITSLLEDSNGNPEALRIVRKLEKCLELRMLFDVAPGLNWHGGITLHDYVAKATPCRRQQEGVEIRFLRGTPASESVPVWRMRGFVDISSVYSSDTFRASLLAPFTDTKKKRSELEHFGFDIFHPLKQGDVERLRIPLDTVSTFQPLVKGKQLRTQAHLRRKHGTARAVLYFAPIFLPQEHPAAHAVWRATVDTAARFTELPRSLKPLQGFVVDLPPIIDGRAQPADQSGSALPSLASLPLGCFVKSGFAATAVSPGSTSPGMFRAHRKRAAPDSDGTSMNGIQRIVEQADSGRIAANGDSEPTNERAAVSPARKRPKLSEEDSAFIDEENKTITSRVEKTKDPLWQLLKMGMRLLDDTAPTPSSAESIPPRMQAEPNGTPRMMTSSPRGIHLPPLPACIPSQPSGLVPVLSTCAAVATATPHALTGRSIVQREVAAQGMDSV